MSALNLLKNKKMQLNKQREINQPMTKVKIKWINNKMTVMTKWILSLLLLLQNMHPNWLSHSTGMTFNLYQSFSGTGC